MSRTSVAAVAVRPRQTLIQSVPVPEIGADAGLLRVAATGVCGSDWPMYLTDAPGPRILGHEMVGTIEAVGAEAAARWGVAAGDVVALEEYLPCGHCEFCRSGEYRSCLETDSRLPGTLRYGSTPLSVSPSLWGGFSQYLYLHPRTVMHKVPPGVPDHIAAMAIPLGNGFQWAVMDGAAGPGKTVVVQGPGQTGLACVLAAKAAGARHVILSGLSRDEARFAVGRRLGADAVVAVDQNDLAVEVSRLTEGRMADLVIEASSAGPEIINSSLALLRKRGTLLLASRKGRAASQMDTDRLMGMQITVTGVRGHSYAAVELALATMASKRFPVEAMSSRVIGLDEVDHALRTIGGETGESAIHITVAPWKGV